MTKVNPAAARVMLKARVFVAAFILALPATLPASTTLSAHELIENLSTDILAVARESNEKDYRTKLRSVIDDKYIERIDFLRIAKAATGAKAFNNATADQQNALVHELRAYLNGLLISAARNLPEYTIELLPSDGRGKKKTKVGIILKDATNGFKLEAEVILHSLDGPWKIYDLNIAGTSAMLAVKFFIKNSIKKHGIDGLISDLKKLNAASITPE